MPGAVNPGFKEENMKQLETCPFCGSPVKMVDNSKDFTADRKRFYIICTNEPVCGYMLAFKKNYDRNYVINHFNRRTEK